MDKEKKIEQTFESIKNIEKQIEFFKNKKMFFWQKSKIKKNSNRIKMLEELKEGLYKTLEYKVDNHK